MTDKEFREHFEYGDSWSESKLEITFLQDHVTLTAGEEQAFDSYNHWVDVEVELPREHVVKLVEWLQRCLQETAND